jgi:hypothetical protein
MDWMPAHGRLTLSAVGFRIEEKDAIDYAKQQLATSTLTFAESWQAINVPNLNLTGAETSLQIGFKDSQQIQLSYTAVQAGRPPSELVSEYAYNYAAQNSIFRWNGQIPGRWSREFAGYTQVNVVQKTGHTAYPLWDSGIARNAGSLRPYLRFLNLSNTGYQGIQGVPLQGRTVMGGIEWVWRSQ